MARDRAVGLCCLALFLCATTPLFAAVSDQEAPASQAENTALAADTESSKPSVEVDWYGYIKLDASWDESVTNTGNFARWVESPSVIDEHSHFNMTARQSRLGIGLSHELSKGPSVDAKVEIDFYGGGGENRNEPLLRHAYFDLDWSEGRWLLRAGQTSDLVSPLAPATINYSVAWWAGNIGYRHPQLTVIHQRESSSGSKTRLAAGISRTIGDDFGKFVPCDSGVDSGVPTLQLAASRSFAVGSSRNLTLGLSGHWGEEHLEEEQRDSDPEFDSWSANLDFQLSSPNASLKLEAWTGENLDDYFGGIGQGIDFDRELGIGASGGWLAYDLRLRPSLSISLGAGIDDPKDSDLPSGARARNLAVWQNVWWDLNEAVRIGAEASWWETEYKELEDGDSFRLQTSVVYSFSR